MFEKASKQKLRFESTKGLLTTEDLWDLPLSSRSGFDLDSVAKEVNQKLKAEVEESFVQTTTNSAANQLNLKLEILKHIIADKQAKAREAEQRVMQAQARQKLEDVLAKKKDSELENLSIEEIQARLASL